LAAALIAPAPPAGAEGQSPPRKAVIVHFAASDGVRIEADFLRPRGEKPALVLMHGLGASRREWDPFAAELARAGFGVLQVDGRGHGRSGGPRYTEFRGTADWDAAGRDLLAAVDFLKSRGIPARRVGLMGASIGANLSLRAAVSSPEVPFAVLLSPGMDYQGIRIKPDFMKFDRPLLLAAAPDDPYAMRTCLELAMGFKNPVDSLIKAATGHGAQMFSGESNRPFARDLLRWLFDRAQGLKASPRRPSAASPSSSPGAGSASP
jgi:alpha-beta hydrolase superfamily lysophospholipase